MLKMEGIEAIWSSYGWDGDGTDGWIYAFRISTQVGGGMKAQWLCSFLWINLSGLSIFLFMSIL